MFPVRTIALGVAALVSLAGSGGAQASTVRIEALPLVENDIEANSLDGDVQDHNKKYHSPGSYTDSYAGATITGQVTLSTPRVQADSKAVVADGYQSVGGVSYADLQYKIRFSGPSGQIGVSVSGRAQAYASDANSDVTAFVRFYSDQYSLGSVSYGAGDRQNEFRVEERTGTGETKKVSFSDTYLFTANVWYDVWIDAAAFSSADADGITSSTASAYADPYFELTSDLASVYTVDLTEGAGNLPIPLAAVPLPPGLALFGLGLVALGACSRCVNGRRGHRDGRTALP